MSGVLGSCRLANVVDGAMEPEERGGERDINWGVPPREVGCGSKLWSEKANNGKDSKGIVC